MSRTSAEIFPLQIVAKTSQKYNRSTDYGFSESENEKNNSISHDLHNWFIMS